MDKEPSLISSGIQLEGSCIEGSIHYSILGMQLQQGHLGTSASHSIGSCPYFPALLLPLPTQPSTLEGQLSAGEAYLYTQGIYIVNASLTFHLSKLFT
jgi:hypothetical protein